MGPMHSISEEDKKLLLEIARAAIAEGVKHGCPLDIDLENYSERLRMPAATFVTLYENGKLAGCIGSLEADQPLIKDIAANAYSAAFRDHRFSPVRAEDIEGMTIEISVLSPLEPLAVADEEELKEQLVAHSDGLVIDTPGGRATFLPKVWQSLPDKALFVRQLKLKAGLAEDYWSGGLNCYKYRTETFADV